MKLKICSLEEVQKYMDEGWPDFLISLVDSNFKGEWDSVDERHLVLYFDDITIPRKGYVLPQMSHVLEILKFAARVDPDKNLLVHCHQGISRSTAAAIAISIQNGLEYEDAFESICNIRPGLWPNQRMIGIIDDIFNLGGELGRFVADWKRDEFIKKYKDEIAEKVKNSYEN